MHQGRNTLLTYHYDEVSVPLDRIESEAVAVLTPIPSKTLLRRPLLIATACGSFLDCDACVDHGTTFDCRWCPSLGRCSDGIERFREDFLKAGCDLDVSIIAVYAD